MIKSNVKIRVKKRYLTKIFLSCRIHTCNVCVAQPDRALGYGPRCREFESSHAREGYPQNQMVLGVLLYIKVEINFASHGGGNGDN